MNHVHYAATSILLQRTSQPVTPAGMNAVSGMAVCSGASKRIWAQGGSMLLTAAVSCKAPNSVQCKLIGMNAVSGKAVCTGAAKQTWAQGGSMFHLQLCIAKRQALCTAETHRCEWSLTQGCLHWCCKAILGPGWQNVANGCVLQSAKLYALQELIDVNAVPSEAVCTCAASKFMMVVLSA